MRFKAYIKTHLSDKFDIDLEFENPENVKNAEIELEILVPEIFKSASSFDGLD